MADYNIKIDNNKVIFDGHADTKEECETITLLCDSLAKDKNFKQVAYDKGYAAFKRVGHTEELKFWNTAVIAGTLNGETFNISATGASTSGNFIISASISTTGLQVTFSGNLGGRATIIGNNAENYFVPWDNTIEYSAGDTVNFEFKSGVQLLSTPGTLDDGFAITLSATSKISVDLTTLPGWSSLSSGTHNITVVAKAYGYRDSEPSAAVNVTKGAAFKQIFPTKDSDGNTLLENLNQSKIYSIYISDNYLAHPSMTYLTYSSGVWKSSDDSYFGSVGIISQTANSVKICINIYKSYLQKYVGGITLEGNTKANVNDFDGLSSTNVYGFYMCFVEGTKITLSDGSTKLVQDIQYDDKVLCYDFKNGVQTVSYIDWMIPERIATKYWEITLSDGTILNLVGSNGKSHRLYNITKQRFDYPQDFEADDLTLKEDGTTAYVVSCREVEKEVKFYNIASHEHINVYANGVLTSNRLNNRFKIVDNKFTDEKVMSDKEVKDYCDYLERIKAK